MLKKGEQIFVAKNFGKQERDFLINTKRKNKNKYSVQEKKSKKL